jgi:hypothetical protein
MYLPFECICIVYFQLTLLPQEWRKKQISGIENLLLRQKTPGSVFLEFGWKRSNLKILACSRSIPPRHPAVGIRAE